MRDRFTIAAPINGYLDRIQLNEGDRVTKGTLVARIDPLATHSSVQVVPDSTEMAIRRQLELHYLQRKHNIRCDSHKHHELNDRPCCINFPPFQPCFRYVRMGVVIIVPSFSIG